MDTKYTFLGREDRLGLYTNDYLRTERESASMTVDVIGWIITFIAYVLALLTFPVSVFFCVKIIQDYEKAVIFRLGRLQPVRGPGVIIVLPCVDKWDRVDMRVKAFNVPPQKILTKDQAAVLVGADVQFVVKDAVASKGVIQDLNHSMRVLAQTTLVNLIMSRKLIEIQNDKKFIGIHAQDALNKATKSWGVQIQRIEINHCRRCLKKLRDYATYYEENPHLAIGNLFILCLPYKTSSEPQTICPPPDVTPDLSSIFRGSDNPLSSIFQAIQSATSGTATPVFLPSSSFLQPPPPSLATRASTPEAQPLEPEQLVAIFNHVTDERLVQDIACVYQFNIGGGGGTWYLDLKNGRGHAGKGPPLGCKPDAIISFSTEDMRALFAGEITAFNAYMQGRVNVEGDVRMAMKLQAVVERIKQPRQATKLTAQAQNSRFARGRDDVMIV